MDIQSCKTRIFIFNLKLLLPPPPPNHLWFETWQIILHQVPPEFYQINIIPFYVALFFFFTDFTCFDTYTQDSSMKIYLFLPVSAVLHGLKATTPWESI